MSGPIFNPFLVQERYSYDPMTGAVIIERYQECEPILEMNAEGANSFSGYSDFITPVANVPNALIEKWLTEEGLNFYDSEHYDHILKTKINSGDYTKLRCIPGKI